MRHRAWILLSAAAVVVLALVAAPPAQADGDPGVLTLGGRCHSPTNGDFLVTYSVSNVPYDHFFTEIRLTSGGAIAAAYMNLYDTEAGTVTANIDSGIASASAITTSGAPYATMYYDGVPSGQAVATVEIDAGGPDHFTFKATYRLSCATGTMVVRRIFAVPGERLVPYTGIHLQSADLVAPYLGVANDDGVKPCGVFDVNGWGRKYIGLGDFPACTPPDLTVMCFNDEGKWVEGTAKDVYLRPDGAELDFISSQHGICGIFPTK